MAVKVCGLYTAATCITCATVSVLHQLFESLPVLVHTVPEPSAGLHKRDKHCDKVAGNPKALMTLMELTHVKC